MSRMCELEQSVKVLATVEDLWLVGFKKIPRVEALKQMEPCQHENRVL